MQNKIAIYGASGHGKVIADIARSIGYDDIIFIDDGDNDFLTFEDFFKRYQKSIPIALGIGENRIRKIIYDKLKKYGICIKTLIHKTSSVSPLAVIGEGTVVMPLSVVNADAFIGKGVILNSSCVIEHDNQIGDFVHISPNASLAGNVKVGEFSHIGIGSSIIQGINIGKNSIVGAGSVVIRDVNDFAKIAGVPATQIGS